MRRRPDRLSHDDDIFSRRIGVERGNQFGTSLERRALVDVAFVGYFVGVDHRRLGHQQHALDLSAATGVGRVVGEPQADSITTRRPVASIRQFLEPIPQILRQRRAGIEQDVEVFLKGIAYRAVSPSRCGSNIE